MKIVIDDNIIIYLNRQYFNIDNENIENIIKKIKEKYKIKLEGYLDIIIHKDKYYGIIMEINKIEYLDYFNNDLELNVTIEEDVFLYETDDILNIDLNYITIYKDREKIYLRPNKDINIEKLIENSNIIYGKKAKKIIKKNMEVIIWKKM